MISLSFLSLIEARQADYEIENCEDDAECNLPIIDYRLLESAQ